MWDPPIIREHTTEVSESRGKASIVNDHHMIQEGAQEAVIGAFVEAHEGHIQDVEIQRGTWSIYCRCARCEDIHTYEVDNEARERALGLPAWQEDKKWAYPSPAHATHGSSLMHQSTWKGNSKTLG